MNHDWAHLSKPVSATILRDIPDNRDSGPLAETSMESSPQAIYRAEKDKALRERRITHLQLMQEAQEAFRKMLADAQLARKGGRPKSANTPAAAAAAAKKKAAATKSVSDAVEVTITPTAVEAKPERPAVVAKPAPTPKRAAVKHAPSKKPAPVVAKRHAAPAKASASRAAAKRSEPAKAAPRRAAKGAVKHKASASKPTRARAASKRR